MSDNAKKNGSTPSVPVPNAASNTTTNSANTNVTGTNADAEKKADTATSKKSKLEALREASSASKEKAISESLKKMELFDSTTAADWKTTGAHALGAMKKESGSIIVTGRNIGAEQREPEWSPEQSEVIKKATSTRLEVRSYDDTRRSIMDPDQEYVGRDDNGSIVPTEKAFVSTLTPEEYVIGLGPEKYDTTGTPRYYMDAVVASNTGAWLVNQWTSDSVVIEGVAQNVLMQQNRTGNTSGRRIGHHFARIGLPKYAFGPLFATLSEDFPGTMTQVAQTKGYYWMNASWGVASFQGTFAYRGESGIERVTNLLDVMRMLNGKSCLCLGTLAISITCKATMQDGKPTMDINSFGLSVKLHNAFAIDYVDYHGPPQQGSTGMQVPSRIAENARIMSRNTTSMPTSGAGMFSSANKGLFGKVNAPAPTIKSADNNSYMK